MQIIEILRESVGLPLALGPSANSDSPLPTFVAARVKQSRLWHLIAWSDDVSGTVGLWQKGQSIALRQAEVAGLSVDFMRGAKGPGWVALEARVRVQSPPISVLQSMPFNPDALDWLLQNQAKIAHIFGHHIAVNDLGSDY